MKLTENIYLVGSGAIGISDTYDCHVYLLKSGKDAALIDTGAGLNQELIIKNMEKEGFAPGTVSRIFVTHSHSDHAGGAKEIKAKTGGEVYASGQEAHLIKNGTDDQLGLKLAKASNQYPADYAYPHTSVDVIVSDGQCFEFKEFRLKAITLSGHSLESVCYLMEKSDERFLFCGDTVFFGGRIGLINCYGSTMEGYRKDIGKLADLNVTGLLPGHFLFTLKNAQQHIDAAIKAFEGGFVPRTLGS